MFSRHNLTVDGFNWERVATHNNQMTLVLCVLFLLLALIVVSSRRKLSLILTSLFLQRHFSLIQREGKMLKENTALAVLFFDILAISASIVQFSSIYIPNFLPKVPLWGRTGIFFATLLLAFLLKTLLYQLYSFLFDRKKENVLLSQYKFMFVTDVAFIAFPFTVVIEYTGLNFLFYVMTGALAVLFGTWVYRLAKINLSNGNKFHFFLYFCALEILPWLILVKFMLKF